MVGRRKLGQILTDAGVITKQQLNKALADQKLYGGKLGSILLDRRFITEKAYFKALTEQLKIPAIDFTKSTISENVIKLIPQEIIEKHIIFPVATRKTAGGNILLLAMEDPTNVSIQDEIRFLTGLKIEPCLALDTTIRRVISEYFYQQNGFGDYRMQYSEENGAGDVEGVSENLIERTQDRKGGTKGGEAQAPLGEDILDLDAMGKAKPAPKEPIKEPPKSNQPNLTRELKALLILLAKKGILNQKEYFEQFEDIPE